MSTELAGLEEQRDVLLRSLRDLEQERAAGEIGDDDYATLKDDYTVRAAAVLRAIEAERSAAPPSRSARRRPAASAYGARTGGRRAGGARTGRAPAVGGRSGRRGSGHRPAHGPATTTGQPGTDPATTTGQPGTDPATTTGQPGTDPAATTGEAGAGPAAAGVPAAAGIPAAGGRAARGARTAPARRGRPAEARRRRSLVVTLGVALAIVAVAGGSVALFAGGRTGGQPLTGSVPGSSSDRVAQALSLETQGKAVDALKLYDDVLREDPGNAEALTYRGWLLKRAGLPDQALESLDRAVAVDPTFPDAHFFRGMVLYQDKDDPAGAVVEFKAFLANNPPADYVSQVEQVLAEAEAAAAAKAAPAVPTPSAGPSDPAVPPA